jgi:hypothetical protein
MFAEARGESGEARGKFSQPVSSARVAGERPVRQRSLSAESTFGSFGASKEQASAANERNDDFI